jgi:hypothetical protein
MTIVSRSELKTLAEGRDGWHVSLFMPTHRAGPEIQQDPIRLKNLLGEAEDRLIAAGLRSSEARGLLEAAQEVVELPVFWRHQSDGLAIFISSELSRLYRLPLDFEELVVVADRFHIKPLLPLLTGDGRFYILALSQNEVRLLQGTRHSVGQVELREVPESLSEALKWDDPERRLQWHTQTGNRVDGLRGAVFHGHGVASADDPKDYIRRYFRQIDEGLHDILRDEKAPLLLAGVDYVLPLYREANTYQHLMGQEITGNPEHLSAQELHQEAWAIVEPYFERGREEARAKYRELSGTDSELASSRLEEVVAAAYHGRVETLFVALGSRQWGSFDVDTNQVHLHEEQEPGDEDLLDYAAVHTLLNGGTVYALEPGEVPDGEPLAAVFRY